jgi:hypothetical protein
MNTGTTLKFIVARQRHWADARRLEVSANGRVLHVEDNLFAPLNSETRTEFAAGDGDGFGTADEVGKIHSLQVSGPSPFD